MINKDQYTTETIKKITNILTSSLGWEEDHVFGLGSVACITEAKVADMVAALVREGIGDINTIANIWLQYCNKVEYERDVARRVIHEFAESIACDFCPYENRCDIAYVCDPTTNYDDCYNMMLKFGEQDLLQEKESERK